MSRGADSWVQVVLTRAHVWPCTWMPDPMPHSTTQTFAFVVAADRTQIENV